MITYKKFITRDEVNLDTTHRCSLLCPNCERQTSFTNFGKKVPGVDVSEDSFNKIIKYSRKNQSIDLLRDIKKHIDIR